MTRTSPAQARELADSHDDLGPSGIGKVLRSLAQQVEELTLERHDNHGTISILAKHLAGVAIALKGPELSLHRHEYQDLEKRATVAMLEIELQKVQIAELIAELEIARIKGFLAQISDIAKERDALKPDADRYKKLRARTKAQRGSSFDQMWFILPNVKRLPDQNIMQGSVAQHLDTAVDAMEAAS